MDGSIDPLVTAAFATVSAAATLFTPVVVDDAWRRRLEFSPRRHRQRRDAETARGAVVGRRLEVARISTPNSSSPLCVYACRGKLFRFHRRVKCAAVILSPEERKERGHSRCVSACTFASSSRHQCQSSFPRALTRRRCSFGSSVRSRDDEGDGNDDDDDGDGDDDGDDSAGADAT